MDIKVNYISDVEIILGTYEEFLLGYKIRKLEDKSYSLTNSFANHSHQASVRCCASSCQFLASGGADETIHLYDMYTRKEHGTLVQQNGTITALQFHGHTHMFSGSEDGTLCVWRIGNWICEKILKGHRGAVTSMSIHPSGKLALSVGRDRTLRTWNLIKGRSAYVTNLASVKGNKYGVDTGAEDVRWCPDGVHYAVSYRTKIDVYDLNIAGVVYTVDQGDRRVTCIHFISDEVMAVGSEAGVIEFHNVKLKKKVMEWKAYVDDERVRCIASVRIMAEEKLLIVTSSSNGLVKLWKLSQDKINAEPKSVGEINASCRITCLTLCVPGPRVNGNRRKNKKSTEVKLEDDEEGKMDAEPECVGEINASPRITCPTLRVPDTGVDRKRKKNKKSTEEDDDENQKRSSKEEDEVVVLKSKITKYKSAKSGFKVSPVTPKEEPEPNSVSEENHIEVEASKKKKKKMKMK